MVVSKSDPNGTNPRNEKGNPFHDGSERPSTSTGDAKREIIHKLKKTNNFLLKKKIYSLHSMIAPKKEETPTTTKTESPKIGNESTSNSEESLDFNLFVSDEQSAYGATYIDGDSDADFNCNLENNIISFDSEWDSDFSNDLENNNVTVEKKKKPPQSPEDNMSEDFRTYFLQTFQNLPRLSQISLDQNQSPTNKTKNKILDSDELGETTSQASELKNVINYVAESSNNSHEGVKNVSELENSEITPKLGNDTVVINNNTTENENIEESSVPNNRIPGRPIDEDKDEHQDVDQNENIKKPSITEN